MRGGEEREREEGEERERRERGERGEGEERERRGRGEREEGEREGKIGGITKDLRFRVAVYEYLKSTTSVVIYKTITLPS